MDVGRKMCFVPPPPEAAGAIPLQIKGGGVFHFYPPCFPGKAVRTSKMLPMAAVHGHPLEAAPSASPGKAGEVKPLQPSPVKLPPLHAFQQGCRGPQRLSLHPCQGSTQLGGGKESKRLCWTQLPPLRSGGGHHLCCLSPHCAQRQCLGVWEWTEFTPPPFPRAE